jgi:hypothetical protein
MSKAPVLRAAGFGVAMGLVGAGGACAGARGGAGMGVHAGAGGRAGVGAAAVPVSRARQRDADDDQRGPAPSHFLGTIGRKTVGPYAAHAKDSGVVVWIATAEQGAGAELFVLPLGSDGAPLGAAHVVASVPREVTSLVVRSMESTHGGWLIAWAALLDRGESITAIALAQDGTARGTAQEVRRTSDHVAWADLVPTPAGAMSVWAEQTVGGEVSLLAAAIAPDGKLHSMPARAVRGVVRWAVVRAGDGAALALVTRGPNAAGGLLSWLRLDAEGHAQGEVLPIGKQPTVSSDVDVVPSRDGWVLSWTDRGGEDAHVALATVDAAGAVHGPVGAINAVGGSSLVAMASGPAGIALAWESPHGLARPRRLLHLATVSNASELTVQPVASFAVAGHPSTELVATDDGFAILTTPTPQCAAPGKGSEGCGPAMPVFLRYDAQLSAIQAEPLVIGKEHTPSALGWGLACVAGRCTALAATGDTPTAVYAVDLASRHSPYTFPLATSSPAQQPRASSLVTLESGGLYTDIGITQLGHTTLLATLASSPNPKEERLRGGWATVAVRPYDHDGHPLAAATTLTSHALPVGRIAIAQGRQNEGEAAVAWVGRDDGDPQVHLARVDGRGRRTKEMQLTGAKGDASDVALAWVGDGWMVAWIDGRDGNGEVYAAKVDVDLRRVSPETRVTRAPGDATDVAIASNRADGGDTVWLAWSDSRESAAEGLGDIYATTLRARDAKRMGDEMRVLATAAHSRSPQLGSGGRTAWVGWIEDAPPGVDAAGATMMAELDEKGHVVGAPRAVRLADEGRPTSIAFAPTKPYGGFPPILVARSAHDGVTLDAVTAEGATSVLDLEAAAPFEVSLVLAGDSAYYVDAGASPAERRVRCLGLAWPSR